MEKIILTKPITSFFNPVIKSVHTARVKYDWEVYSSTTLKEKEETDKVRSEINANKAAVSTEALKHKLKVRKREERANKKVKESFSSSSTSIESVDDDDDDDDDDSTEADLITSNEQSSKKRQYVTRPDNWAIIGEHFEQHKFESTLKVFKQHLEDEGYETTMVKCFQRWKKGWSKKKAKQPNPVNLPCYGMDVERELDALARARIDCGMTHSHFCKKVSRG